jgi:four helix bundle protein
MRDHTSLHAWQEAHAVTLLVIQLLRTAWKPYGSALFYQLQRAALSVQLNIAEGYTFGDSPTFTRHLGVAYGSAVETGELLRLLADAAILRPEALTEVRQRNARSQRLILGLLKRRRALRS